MSVKGVVRFVDCGLSKGPCGWFAVCCPWSAVCFDFDVKAVIARVKVTRVVTASADLFIKFSLKAKLASWGF